MYVSTGDESRFPRLMGYSMALYMVGMSASPTIAGFLPGFYTSFVVALSIFSMSLLYLCFFVPVITVEQHPRQQSLVSRTHSRQNGRWRNLASGASHLWSPLIEMCKELPVLAAGLSILLFDTTQAYIFPALMVYTSTKFSFTRIQNGYILSIAATVSAMYLMTIYYLKPRLSAIWHKSRQRGDSPQPTRRSDLDTGSLESNTDINSDCGRGDSAAGSRAKLSLPSRADYTRALLSLLIYIVVLPVVVIAANPAQIYALTSAIALGMSAPSFIKSYAVSIAKQKPEAVASLAIMESIGSLLSTLVLGTVQSITNGGDMVFIAASAIVAGSLFTLVVSPLLG